MKNEDFKDSDLHYVQKWVIVDNKGSEAHVFEDIEDTWDEGELVVEFNANKTPMYATTQENIN